MKFFAVSDYPELLDNNINKYKDIIWYTLPENDKFFPRSVPKCKCFHTMKMQEAFLILLDLPGSTRANR